MPHTAPRIFLSYAVNDGTGAAGELRRRLESEGFSIWQDVIALEGGRDWWSQIEEAIRAKSVEHLVLVLSPDALSRPVVRREIRLARTLGKQVTPVRSGPELKLDRVPRWLGNVLDPAKPDGWAKIIETVGGPSRQRRMPMMAPEPPADFVERPKEFQALKQQLLDVKGDAAVGITAALRGAGGYGKTTLAKALAHDPDIQEAYFDGVLWVELGERGAGRVVALISDLVTLITGVPPAIATRDAAATALADALGDRRFLLIIDDVWQRAALDPFMKGGPSTTRLVTTRFDRELPDAAVRQAVDAMAQDEAQAMLSWGLQTASRQQHTLALQALSASLGEWPQLLKLVNGFLRDRVVKHKQGLAAAIEDVTKRLEKRGLTDITILDDKRAKDYDARHQSVAAVIGTTLELLGTEERARFAELAIFQEDADIPIGIAARLWRQSGGINEIGAEDLLRELYDLSLLLELDFDRRTLRLHDTTRHFLLGSQRPEIIAGLHRTLVNAMGDMGGAKEVAAQELDYFYRHLPFHLATGGERELLDALLEDAGWLRDKLAIVKSAHTLVTDYARYSAGSLQRLVFNALRLATPAVTLDRRQLLPQLLGRIGPNADARAPAFLAAVRRHIEKPALIPLEPSLDPPSAAINRLKGHRRRISALALLPGNRLASAGDDKFIRVWDLETKTEVFRLNGPESAVHSLIALSGGRMAVGSGQGDIHIWDLNTNTRVKELRAYDMGAVLSLFVLADGRLACGGVENVIHVWNTSSWERTSWAQMTTRGAYVTSMAQLPSGRVAAGSCDNLVRFWDAATGTEVARLEGHGSPIFDLTLLNDGRLASCCQDGFIRVWNVQTLQLELSFRVEDGSSNPQAVPIHGLVTLRGDRLASVDGKGTVRLWTIEDGHSVILIDSDAAGGYAGQCPVCVLPDGRLVLGLSDGTLYFSDPISVRSEPSFSSAKGNTAGNRAPISALVALGQDLVASAVLPKHHAVAPPPILGGATSLAPASSYEIRIWNVETGVVRAILNGHTGRVSALSRLTDDLLVSGSADSTMRIWNIATGVEVARIDGVCWEPTWIATIRDTLVCARDAEALHIVKYYKEGSGIRIVLDKKQSNGDKSSRLIELSRERLAAATADHTIRVRRTNSDGSEMEFSGHTEKITALLAMSDDTDGRLRLASGSEDGSVRVWDLSEGTEIARLDLDAAVTSVTRLTGGRLLVADSRGGLHKLILKD